MTKHNYPPADSFHWRDDIFFRVEPDGAVRCWKFGKRHFFTIPPSEWQSVVKWIALQQRSAPIVEDALVEWKLTDTEIEAIQEAAMDATEMYVCTKMVRAVIEQYRNALHEKKG